MITTLSTSSVSMLSMTIYRQRVIILAVMSFLAMC